MTTFCSRHRKQHVVKSALGIDSAVVFKSTVHSIRQIDNNFPWFIGLIGHSNRVGNRDIMNHLIRILFNFHLRASK